ncbi:hypothetical protein AHF37_12280 [Paragonimus kellicotti]|nr:hypothetical protein AHF37_12280 [Paragonimus kellicotti]
MILYACFDISLRRNMAHLSSRYPSARVFVGVVFKIPLPPQSLRSILFMFLPVGICVCVCVHACVSSPIPQFCIA